MEEQVEDHVGVLHCCDDDGYMTCYPNLAKTSTNLVLKVKVGSA